MGDKWHTTALGGIFKVKHGFAFKGEYFTEEPNVTTLVTPGNFAISGGFQDGKRKYYNGPVLAEYILKPGQIVVTMTDLSKESDTLGHAARIPLDSMTWLHNQRVGLLEFNQNVETSPRFIEYLLRSHDYRSWIVGSATGTTVKHTSPSRIEGFVARIPSFRAQVAIAHILGTLDDKIELNRSINETLEAMARAIFKSWFVDFDPVKAKAAGNKPFGMDDETAALFPSEFEDSELGPIPKGWRLARLNTFLNLLYGKALPADQRTKGGIPVYGSGGINGFHNHALLDSETVIVGRKGTVGSLFWEDRPSFPIDTVFYVQPIAPLAFCYHVLESLPLRDMNTDAAVPGLNRENVYRLEIPSTPAPLVQVFSKIAVSFRNQIQHLKRENDFLAQTRDLLLPKLLSGEIELN